MHSADVLAVLRRGTVCWTAARSQQHWFPTGPGRRVADRGARPRTRLRRYVSDCHCDGGLTCVCVCFIFSVRGGFARDRRVIALVFPSVACNPVLLPRFNSTTGRLVYYRSIMTITSFFLIIIYSHSPAANSSPSVLVLCIMTI